MTTIVDQIKSRPGTHLGLLPVMAAAFLSSLVLVAVNIGIFQGGVHTGIGESLAVSFLPNLTWPLILVATVMALWRYRGVRPVVVSLLAVLPLFAVQMVLRGGLVSGNPAPGQTALSVGSLLLLQGFIVAAGVFAFRQGIIPEAKERFYLSAGLPRLTLITTGLVFITLISGATVTLTGAGTACVSWPFCGAAFWPADALGWVHLGHRFIVALTAVFVLFLLRRAWQIWRDQTILLTLSTTVTILFFAQGLIGAVQVLHGQEPALVVLHAVTNAVLWAVLVVLVVNAGFGRSRVKFVPAASSGRERLRWRSFLALTKPIVVLLLLMTTFGGMVVAAGAFPPLGLTALTLFGGALAAGGSSAINQYIDRNRDRLMTRTAKRPLPAGKLQPAEALAFGIGLCLISNYLLAVLVNPLAAFLSVLGIVYYVIVYSLVLKHVTVHNIVIGGGAGAIPPLVGWAAVTNHISVAAFMLFVLIFLWTPPHFWALALVRRNDYLRAGVPMLPVVRGEPETRRQIFIYTLILVGFTLLLPLFHLGGVLYIAGAVALGLMLILSAWKVLRRPGNKVAWKMYRHSSMYLAFLFLVMVVDAVLLG